MACYFVVIFVAISYFGIPHSTKPHTENTTTKNQPYAAKPLDDGFAGGDDKNRQNDIGGNSSLRPPNKVDPETIDFFDPVTGEAKIWYWRDSDGQYEFFDNPGFHPKAGDELKRVDASVIRLWRLKKAETDAREIQDHPRQEDEANAQGEQQKVQNQKEASAQRTQREAQAGAMCDQLAANPTDTRKSSEAIGVRYEELKGHAREALEVCGVAVEAYPNELRYRYQYARALEVNAPDKAIPIYRQLIRERYAAAYDNLANILLRRRDMRSAIAVLKGGVEAEDPDSMVTLAELIERGYLPVRNPEGAKYALLGRAARLGHAGAQLAIEQLKSERQNIQQRAFQQQQEQQMMLDVFGTILRSIPR
ncbi:hypothetical protein [Methylocystis sp. B8]|uniref:tetratricopeptide repeat protein n=1 Tax=Methylocystis sp. B8 TaxID=544938 RepID=UPI0010FD2632|nr:hypothetical protein [Methylocystis sp. B8]TLG79116.1 hypothetical protein FEV16_03620 [Methylocystis sp. B8]